MNVTKSHGRRELNFLFHLIGRCKDSGHGGLFYLMWKMVLRGLSL